MPSNIATLLTSAEDHSKASSQTDPNIKEVPVAMCAIGVQGSTAEMESRRNVFVTQVGVIKLEDGVLMPGWQECNPVGTIRQTSTHARSAHEVSQQFVTGPSSSSCSHGLHLIRTIEVKPAKAVTDWSTPVLPRSGPSVSFHSASSGACSMATATSGSHESFGDSPPMPTLQRPSKRRMVLEEAVSQPASDDLAPSGASLRVSNQRRKKCPRRAD